METKKCKKCGEARSLSMFYVRHYTCKRCESDFHKNKRIEQNKIKILFLTENNIADSVYNKSGINKQCTKCGKIDSFENFVLNKQCLGGCTSLCRICGNKNQEIWRKANKNKVSQYHNNWRLKNLDHVRGTQKKYAIKNRKKINKQQNDRRLKNVEEHRRKAKEYRLKNIEKIRKYDRNRRSTETGRAKHLKSMKEWYHDRGGKDHVKAYESKNKEKIKSRNDKWRQLNPVKLKYYYEKYRERNKEKDREYIKDLHDIYIRKCIDLQSKDISNELIELKRTQLKLYRATNQ